MTYQFTSENDFTKKTSGLLKSFILGEEVSVNFKLKEVLKDRDFTAYALAKETGISYGVIHGYSTGKNMAASALNMEHLIAIIIALRVTDISELLEIEMPVETEDKFKKDLQLWKDNNWRPVYTKKQLED